jgi:hypothetical protein
MKYIKEYHIFDFLKKKKTDKLNWICDFKQDLLYLSSDLERYNHYVDRESDFTSGNIRALDKNPYEKEGHLTVSDRGRVSVSRFSPNADEKLYNIDTTIMDRSLKKNGFFKGSVVYIPDLNTNGKIVEIRTDLISRYNFDLESGKIIKVLRIIDVKGKEHYRTPKQVTLVKIDKMNIEPEIELEIEDYLLDLIDSGKFIIKIDQVKNNDDILNFIVNIGFKDGLNKELENVSRFFSNISQLRKRLNGIGLDIEVDDINKTSVKLLVYKLPIKENIYISKFENMSKGECDICGESIYTDDRICDDCKMNKDEIEFDDTTIPL